jgi:hypothetical protein
LNLPRPWIRPVIPSAVNTSLLSSLCRFHMSILDRGWLWSAYKGGSTKK